jgi:leucine dehydrogenase
VELEGYSEERDRQKTEAVFDNMMRVFSISKEENIPTHEAALRLAKDRIEKVGNLRKHHHGRMARPFSTLREMTSRQNR